MSSPPSTDLTPLLQTLDQTSPYATVGRVERVVGLMLESVGPKVGKKLWRDAALAVLVATLQPGAYSIQVANAAGPAGLVIVEIYEAP